MSPLDPSFSVGSIFWQGLVPERALEIPSEEEIPGIWKDAEGLLLDGALQNVSKAGAVVERQMGRRIARLRDSNGLIKLGFVRLGDYAAERLQLGCRSAQEIARVGAALETLPVLREASDEARVSLSQVRDLVRIVTPETEAEWVELASGLTVRGLREEIEKRGLETAGSDPETGPDQDEDTSELSFQAPAWFRAKWDSAVEFYRKVEGRADLPVGAAAEAFAADWHSGAPPAEVPHDPDVPETPEEIPQPRCPECSDSAGRKTMDRRSARNEAEKGTEERYDHWAYLNAEEKPPVKLPGWLEEYKKARLSDDPFVLDRELTHLEKARCELDGMTGRRLLTMARARLFQSLGFLDMGQYARERLNMGASTARRLKWIERHLSDQAEIRVAYYKGEIGLSKVNLLLRVRFTRKAAAWLERAEAVTVRRLEQEVQLVLRRVALVESGLMTLPEGESPYDPLAEGTDLVRSMSALDEIARKGPENAARTSEPTVTVRCAMESDALELWDDCVDRCRELFGKNLQEWECANRFIDSFFEEFNQEDRLRYALNHKVFERDGWQCTVPGCRSRGDLNSHHPEWLSRGGPDTMPNQTATCRRHHLEAIHEGTVEVEGPAPDGLIWRLGVNADGEALLTVGPGERIMKGDPRCDTSPCS